MTLQKHAGKSNAGVSFAPGGAPLPAASLDGFTVIKLHSAHGLASCLLDIPAGPRKINFVSRIALNQVAKSFRGPRGEALPAVHDLTLAVEPGELLALVGPSGCGKTTTLRLIAGLERPDSGEIQINGQVCNGVPPHLRDIAFVFQSGALYPHMTVRDNLAFGLRVRKLPRSEMEQRLSRAVAMLELGDCLGRFPHELSGGQTQRVALGRALVRRPAIFLLDEPLAHLDEPSRVHLRSWIRRVHEETQSAMLYVTHDQREALALGTRVAVMNQGSLQQAGSPAEIYASPASSFVAAFIGSPPINLIPGELGGRGPDAWFEPQNSDGIVLSLPAGLLDRSVSEPERVTLGLRPEHFLLQKPEGADESWRLPARLLRVETAGADAHAAVWLWERELTVRWPANHHLQPGAAIAVWADMRRARFFSE